MIVRNSSTYFDSIFSYLENLKSVDKPHSPLDPSKLFGFQYIQIHPDKVKQKVWNPKPEALASWILHEALASGSPTGSSSNCY
jgi:hypothetical protein